MNAVYLMQGLGLDTPILNAILEGLPSTKALREMVTFFLECGFSLMHQIQDNELLYMQFILRTTVEILVRITYPRNGKYCQCSATVKYWGLECKFGLNIGQDSYVSMVSGGMTITDNGLPNDILITIFKNRILGYL